MSDIHFWLRTGENGGIRKNLHQFSGWVAAALYDRWLADGRRDFLTSYLDALQLDYTAWERERLTGSGLFWQRDVSDGMESSISGGRKVRNIRPSINSYMYGNATAIAAIARMAEKPAVAGEYAAKAEKLKALIEQQLWNQDAQFFETRLESGGFAPVREEIGYTPWYFDLPDDRYQAAWKQLMDPKGFYAPYGPTTAERRSPDFQVPYQGDDCQWNGPELAVRHHHHAQGAGQRPEPRSTERRLAGRLLPHVPGVLAQPAAHARRRPGGPVHRRRPESAHRRVAGARHEDP